MNKKDLPRFTQIMMGMADNFRDTITKEGMSMRFDMLKGFSIEQVERAAMQILRQRKYTKMPPIAEFFEAIEGSVKSHSLDSWGVVMTGLERGEEPVDLKVREVIRRLGGWNWLSQQSYEDLHWLEKRFIEHFDALDGKQLPALPIGEVAEMIDKIGKKPLELEGGTNSRR